MHILESGAELTRVVVRHESSQIYSINEKGEKFLDHF